MITVLYGPKACGKTRNKVAIARALGISKIVDDWHFSWSTFSDCLHITCLEPSEFQKRLKGIQDVRIISFEEALRIVGGKQ